jgi:hypothetical protein
MKMFGFFGLLNIPADQGIGPDWLETALNQLFPAGPIKVTAQDFDGRPGMCEDRGSTAASRGSATACCEALSALTNPEVCHESI